MLDLCLSADVDSNRQRLEHCAFLQADVVRKLVAEIFWEGVELSESAIVRGCSSECHFFAEIVCSVLAS